MFTFQPEKDKVEQLPYFEDVTRDEGWQGFSTTKSIKTLQGEITAAIDNLGGVVSGFQRGTFMTDQMVREGFQIHYSFRTSNGKMIAGRLDIAALPVRDEYNTIKKDKSLRMALYMLRTALQGMWFMQKLSPGYAALMPWMLTDGGLTLSQRWSDARLLTDNKGEFIEGEVRDGG